VHFFHLLIWSHWFCFGASAYVELNNINAARSFMSAVIDTAFTICVRVYVSVCLSVRLSVPSCATAAACGGFAAVGPAGSRYRSIAARRVCSGRSRLSIHIHSSTALSRKREQCRVYSDVGRLYMKQMFKWLVNSAGYNGTRDYPFNDHTHTQA